MARITKSEWSDIDSDVSKGTARGVAWTVFIVLVVLALIAGVWAITVAWAPWKGEGDAFKRKESATNRIFAQAFFEDTYQEILATDKKIDTAADAVASDPSTVNKTNYTGLVNYCNDVVADYNAEARKYLAKDFRSADLPAQIDDSDPKTDCKETTT